MNKLENIKTNTLRNAKIILNFKDKNYREKNLPELFVQFVCGLLSIKQNIVFYESNITSKETRIFHDTIHFSFEDSFYFKAFETKYNENDKFFCNGTELLHNRKPLISITKDPTSCLLVNSCSETNVKEKNVENHSKLSNNIHSGDDVRPLPSNHILNILRKEKERGVYNVTLMSFVKLCSDLFVPHTLFSKLKFDYFIWRELIRLCVKDNQRQMMSVFPLHESSNEVIFLSCYFLCVYTLRNYSY